MTEAQARAAGLTEDEIAALKLNAGAHSSPNSGHCLLEVVSMFAGEPFSDKPQCVDYVLAEFGRTWNDGMRNDEEREQLKQYIPLLPGTAQGEALSQKRAFMAVDWLIRVHTPMWLELSPALAEPADQAVIEGTEATSLPLLRSRVIEKVALKGEGLGWSTSIAYGIDETSAIHLGDCKIDKFRVEPHEGGTVDLFMRVGTSDVDELNMGRLSMLIGNEVDLSLDPPQKPQDVIDASSDGDWPFPQAEAQEEAPDATDVFLAEHG
jgi:hypothetical protein